MSCCRIFDNFDMWWLLNEVVLESQTFANLFVIHFFSFCHEVINIYPVCTCGTWRERIKTVLYQTTNQAVREEQLSSNLLSIIWKSSDYISLDILHHVLYVRAANRYMYVHDHFPNANTPCVTPWVARCWLQSTSISATKQRHGVLFTPFSSIKNHL